MITKPTIDKLSRLWKSRLSIPEEIKYAFADASPNFDQFISSLEKKEILCVLTESENGDLISATWLHDLELDHEGIPRVGWLGGYVFPEHRGIKAVNTAHMMLNYFEAAGIYDIHTAIHIENRKSQFFIRDRGMMAFNFVCKYPEWTTSGGKLADAFIFTRHARDKMLAWMCARKLASKRLLIQKLAV